MIEFDAETHKYTVGGIVYPSVTQLIPRNPGFGYVTAERLAEKADYGKFVHKCIDNYLKGEESFSFSEEETVIRKHAKKFFSEFGVPTLSESIVWSEKNKFAGTLDLYWANEKRIGDIKTRKADKKRDALQCAGYAIAAKEKFGLKKAIKDWYTIEFIEGCQPRAVYVYNDQAERLFIALVENHWRGKKLDTALVAYFSN